MVAGEFQEILQCGKPMDSLKILPELNVERERERDRDGRKGGMDRRTDVGERVR